MSPCNCGKSAEPANVIRPVTYASWSVVWPDGSLTAFGSEADARTYYEAHPARDRLTLEAPTAP